MKRDERNYQEHANYEMERASSEPVSAIHAKTPREPEDQRRRECPDVACRCLHQKALSVADRLLFRVVHEEDLRAEKQRDNGPYTPD